MNPIGGIAKTDLRKFLLWAAANRGMPTLESIVHVFTSNSYICNLEVNT